MTVITCISFHGTGSGAVDDFFKEFDNCPSAPSDVECRFLQDPDGVCDLEYNLIDNPHRLNSGYALKRYMWYVRERSYTYGKIFGKKWVEYSEAYIDSLTTEKYKGYWLGDLILLPTPMKAFYYFRRLVNKVLPKAIRKPGYFNYFPNKEYLHSFVTREYFLEQTRKYVDNLCQLLNPDNCEFVLLDQLIATSNVMRYIPYVNNLKVIMVDRDPRDLFIQQCLVGDHVLPKDPEIFARVYKDQRKMIGNIPEDAPVLKVRFEDLIFRYEETTSKIVKFTGEHEKNHVQKKEKFNPDVSKKNTQMWLTHPEFKDAAELIQTLLPEYLYPFKCQNDNAQKQLLLG